MPRVNFYFDWSPVLLPLLGLGLVIWAASVSVE